MPDSDRLPDELTLGPVRLQVSDLGRSVPYYEGLLGLRVLDRVPGSASLGAAGGGEPLVLLRERRGAAPVPRRGRLGLYHFAILLPDRAALGRFVKHLAANGVRAGASDHLVSEALYLWDPDGLGIEVYADRPRSEWVRREGELAMATEPLDLESVASAAGEEEWTGMPRGTRIGHLHLHVGDLALAEEFYRSRLGFEATVRSYPGALFLSAGGYHHHLGLNTWAGAAATPAGPDESRLLEWTIRLPEGSDSRAAADRVAAGGYDVLSSSGGWLLTDPWGTSLRLVAGSGGGR